MDSLTAMTARADAIKAAGTLDLALPVYEAAVRAYPGNAIALHNWAACLGDAGQHAKSAQIARKAIALGLKAPETHLVLARALMNSGENDGALAEYETVLRVNPGMIPAQLERAQLVWMLSADATRALEVLEATIAVQPFAPGLHFVKAKALEFMERVPDACEAMEELLRCAPRDVFALGYAANLYALANKPERARELAGAALAAAPGDPGALEAMACALLACGDAPQALELATRLHALRPDNQLAIALQATAWRLLDDPRFGELYDYGALVRTYMLAVPPGWTSLDHYVADLAAELKQVHPFRSHPFGQSVRHGSQRSDVLSTQTPAIQAFPAALDEPLRLHIDHLGTGPDPVRSRNTGRWKIRGAWSVWLRPGGFHADHVHSQGWLSSACYIELPERISADKNEGWLKFGEPGIPTRPALSWQHSVQPIPGMIALFPSFMWHGTIPFGGDEPRLTIAMDVLPG